MGFSFLLLISGIPFSLYHHWDSLFLFLISGILFSLPHLWDSLFSSSSLGFPFSLYHFWDSLFLFLISGIPFSLPHLWDPLFPFIISGNSFQGADDSDSLVESGIKLPKLINLSSLYSNSL